MRSIVELTIIIVAVLGLTAVVLTFARTGESSGTKKRTVVDPDDPDWMDLDAASAHLEVEPAYILNLVARDAIPYFVMAEGDRTDSSSYRFRRNELDDWTVG